MMNMAIIDIARGSSANRISASMVAKTGSVRMRVESMVGDMYFTA